MPPRPVPAARSKHNANRLSAVYIGAGPIPITQASPQPSSSSSSFVTSPPNPDTTAIPDLPEPPSPGASSSGSGLPSPPATNSTGSGSAGDPQSIAIRGRPLSFHSSSSGSGGSLAFKDAGVLNGKSVHRSAGSSGTNMNTGMSSTNADTTRQGNVENAMGDHGEARGDLAAAQDRADDDFDLYHGDESKDDDDEGEDTARFEIRRHSLKTTSNENKLALQRVKSLTERNRMVLDKLSSYPRSGTPLSSASRSSASESSVKNGSSSRLSRTPAHTASRRELTSRSTTSASTSHSQSQHSPQIQHELSGSETERESNSYHSNSNSTSSHHLRSISLSQHTPRSTTRTPPNNMPQSATSSSSRTRHPSAPASPLNAISRVNNLSNSTTSSSSIGSSPSRRRKRVSLATSSVLDLPSELRRDQSDDDDDVNNTRDTYGRRARSSLSFVSKDRLRTGERNVTQTALAAVASSRKSPSLSSGGGRRARGALPLEFRSDLAGGGARRLYSAEPEPMTPYRSGNGAYINGTSSGSTGPRSATVRETRRGGRGKLSDEGYPPATAGPGPSTLSRAASTSSTDPRHDRRASMDLFAMGMSEYRERRQSYRGGSAESALTIAPPMRTLVGEEFRAAGLSPNRSRYRASRIFGRDGSSKVRDEDGFGGDADVVKRLSWQPSEGSSVDDPDDDGGRTSRRASRLGATSRPATSMADYRGKDRHVDDDDDRDDSRLRNSRSALPPREGARELSLTRRSRERGGEVEREREREREIERAASALSRSGTLRSHQVSQIQEHLQEQRRGSPFGGGLRHSSNASNSSAGQEQYTEHTRLLMESLAMFEGQMARLGVGGGHELLKNAQGMVNAAERLNGMLRFSIARALEEQVKVEVDGGDGDELVEDLIDVWRRVVGEYRDGLRASDELVRGLTGFLLGVGKTMRELAAAGGAADAAQQHGRSVSLDEEGLALAGGRKARGTMSPDVVLRNTGSAAGSSGGGGGGGGSGSASGRRSAESRRSWEPKDREEVSRRLGMGRPASALSALREKEASGEQTPPSAPLAPSASLSASTRSSVSRAESTRRLYVPREQREKQIAERLAASTESGESMYADYEPSPTPASRTQQVSTLDRKRTLPPLAIPKPLPALPSETILGRKGSPVPLATSSGSGSGREQDRDRRRATLAPILTVRGHHLPVLTTPSNPTTAITPHTVSLTHTPDKTALPSSGGTEYTEKSARSAVTFSRPSTVSVSALNGLQERDMEYQRKRTGSGASSIAEPSTSVPPGKLAQLLSGVEAERKGDASKKRTTLGGKAGRTSLDSAEESGSSSVASGSRSGVASKAHAADRSAAATAVGRMGPPMNTARRERRRTVTDIWPKDKD